MTRQERITQLITETLNPHFIKVDNESSRHHVPADSETHFKLTVVSDAFEQIAKIDRHRQMNSLLADEFKMGLHALSLHLYSPLEWHKKANPVPMSPPCRGGSQHD